MNDLRVKEELSDAVYTMHRYVSQVFEATGSIALNTALIYQDKEDEENSNDDDTVLSVASGMFDSPNEISGKLFTAGIAFARIAFEDAAKSRTPVLVIASAALTYSEDQTKDDARKVVLFCAYHTKAEVYSVIECGVEFSESGKEAVKISEFSRDDFTESILTKKTSELGDLENVLYPFVMGYKNATKDNSLWNISEAITVDPNGDNEEIWEKVTDKNNPLHDEYRTVKKLTEAEREKTRLDAFEEFLDSIE